MQLFPMTHYEWIMRHGMPIITKDIFEKYGKSYNLSFNEFADYFTELPGLTDFAESEHLSDMNLFARQVYHAFKMQQWGERIYYMSKDVCTLLKNTRLTIDAEFIEAPFEQIYIYTDQEDIVLKDYTGIKPMKGIYLQLNIENNKKLLRFIVTSGVEGIDDRTDINYFATFEIPEHGDLEWIANRDMDKFVKDKSVLNRDVDLEIMKNIFKFAVGALLYIGCKNVDFINFYPENLDAALTRKKSGKKIARIEKRIGKTAQLPFIIINPKKGENDSEGINNIGKRLDHQILVSGHWRGQWSGIEDNKKKEIIRIKPYLKGIGLKEETPKPFVVK